MPAPVGRPNEHMDRGRSHIYRICARQERHRYAQPSAPNGGYLEPSLSMPRLTRSYVPRPLS
jgi:hypothetical protein